VIVKTFKRVYYRNPATNKTGCFAKKFSNKAILPKSSKHPFRYTTACKVIVL